MSRSIHETERQLAKLKREKYSDIGIQRQRVESHEKALRKKYLIKRQRKPEEAAADPIFTEVSSLDIRYPPPNLDAHYLISPEDIHRLVSRLPEGTLSGLSKIDFCPGIQQMEEYLAEGGMEGRMEATRDPYMGRLGHKNGNQVYIPPLLGCYFGWTCRIEIYAYIFREQDILDKQFLTLCKIGVLRTLLHEIAHHDDNMRRCGRGRWFGLASSDPEPYAEKMQKVWSETVLIEFLEQDLRAETDALLKWLRLITTVEISLQDIISFTFCASGLSIIYDFIAKEPRNIDTLFELAEDFHLNDQYEVCLRCLEAIISREPDNFDALRLKADTFIHLEKHEEAGLLVEKLIEIRPNHLPTLELKCDLLWNQEQWQELSIYAEKAIQLAKNEGDEPPSFYLLTTTMMSRLYLGQIDAAKEACHRIEGRFYSGRKQALLAFICLLEGKPDSAIKTCEPILRNNKARTYEKVVSYYTYQLALKLKGVQGNFYRAPRQLEVALKSIGLIKAVERWVPELQDASRRYGR